jgi:hypothetical protein
MKEKPFTRGDSILKRIIYSLFWFLGLAALTKLLLANQSLGYFWIAIACLSLYFGFQSVNKLDLSNVSYQLASWLKTYQDLSYFKQQLYLCEIVNGAVKRNQTEQAMDFLNHILKSEPDNETAKTLMASVWSTALINN